MPEAPAASAPAPVVDTVRTSLPPRVARLVERAQRWIDRRDFAAAEQCMREAAGLVPGDGGILRLLAAALQGQGRHDDALDLLRRAQALRPGDPLIENNLGSALGEKGDYHAAVQAFQRATVAAPGLAASWFNLGMAHEALRQTVAAEAALSRALAIDAGHVEARVLHAGTLRTQGRIGEAAQQFRTALSARPGSAEAWMGLVGVVSGRLEAEEARMLESQYERAPDGSRNRMLLAYAWAIVLEAQERYDEAFRLACEANRARRSRLGWDAVAFSRIMRRIEDAFGGSLGTADGPALGEGIVFLVGMPRSGSTLAEQILSSHPDVAGAGEIDVLAELLREESSHRGSDFPAWAREATPADWTRLGRAYMERVAPLFDGKAHLVDKTLQNWQLVGAIRAMLPDAHVIDCRRDALETCWSCFKHDFGDNLPYTCDLDDLAAHWRDYDRMMRFWARRHPSFTWTLDHEALLADPEDRVRAMLAHCDLSFDPRCLRFHESVREVRTTSASQVRAPLRTDTSMAQRYGHHLDRLRHALAAPGADLRA